MDTQTATEGVSTVTCPNCGTVSVVSIFGPLFMEWQKWFLQAVQGALVLELGNRGYLIGERIKSELAKIAKEMGG